MGPDGHDHPHDVDHPHDCPGDGAAHLDPAVSESDLPTNALARRTFLRAAGLLGGATAVASVFGQLPAAAAERIAVGKPAVEPDDAGETERADRGDPSGSAMLWLAGDHHIHTQYSSDAQYQILQQVGHASIFGLDWVVITDHGGADHARIGVDRTYPDVVAARQAYDDMLVFQGFEWNIPAAEHGTVFVAPFSKSGRTEMDVLKAFENAFDGTVNNWGASTAANENHALDGLKWLAGQVNGGAVPGALFLANHPARKGIDSPTRSGPGATPHPGSPSAWRARRDTRPPGSKHRSARGRVGGSTTTRPQRTRSPVTRWTRTAPSAVSTG